MLCFVDGVWKMYVLRTYRSSLHEAFNCSVIILCNTANIVTPGGLAFWNVAVIGWNMQVSWSGALSNILFAGSLPRFVKTIYSFLGL